MKKWVNKHQKKLLLIIGITILLLTGVFIWNRCTVKTKEKIESRTYHLKEYFLYEGEELPASKDYLEETTLEEVYVKYYQNGIEILNPSAAGEYEVLLKIEGNEYFTKLTIAKKEELSLILKEKVIFSDESYQIEDFIETCGIDNLCSYQFTKEEMAFYKNVGEYPIEIVAKGENGLEKKEQTKLTIQEREKSEAPSEVSNQEEPLKADSSKKEESSLESKPTFIKKITESKTITRVWKYGIKETVEITEDYDLYSDGSKIKVNTNSLVKERNYETFHASTSEMESEALSLMKTNAHQIQEVITLSNQLREEKGISPLLYNEALTKAAMIRAIEMGYSKVFSHTRPDGRNCFTIYDDLHIAYGIAAENIAMGQTSPNQVITSWKNSNGHYQNIINQNIKRIGVGVININNTYYWVQLFS